MGAATCRSCCGRITACKAATPISSGNRNSAACLPILPFYYVRPIPAPEPLIPPSEGHSPNR